MNEVLDEIFQSRNVFVLQHFLNLFEAKQNKS